MIYTVDAKRWAHGWELHVRGVGVTQSRSLAQAEATVKEYVSLLLDVDEADVDVDLVADIDPDLRERVQSAKQETAAAAAMQLKAAVLLRDAAKALTGAGLNKAEAAVVLGVSPQRMSQLKV